MYAVFYLVNHEWRQDAEAACLDWEAAQERLFLILERGFMAKIIKQQPQETP